MQSKTSKNSTEASIELMGLQNDSASATGTASELTQCLRGYPVSRIARGLRENLKNVQKHRLLMQEEINDALRKLMFTSDSNTMPAHVIRIRKDE
jgi:hypothetical protein